MSDICAICDKELSVGVKRFSHLLKHLQDGTGYARLDLKHDYWYFFPKIPKELRKHMKIVTPDGSKEKENENVSKQA